VGTISDFSGKDSFSVSTTLLGLQEKGVIAKKAEEPKEEDETVKLRAAGVPALARFITFLTYVFSMLLVLAFGVSLYFSINVTAENMKLPAASEEIDMLRYEIAVHRVEKGGYPPSMEGTDPWGNPYIYKPGEESFSIRSAGPDGKPGTGDDVY
jgi:hypothetical protein